MLELRHRLQGRVRDRVEGFRREEALVAGDDHVGKREQAREDVVLEDAPGAIFEEEGGLLFVDVQAQMFTNAQMAGRPEARAAVSFARRGSRKRRSCPRTRLAAVRNVTS